MLIETRLGKAQLHLNLEHAQQGKSRRLAEVPSSSDLSRKIGGPVLAG